jgi:hypothetical protein
MSDNLKNLPTKNEQHVHWSDDEEDVMTEFFGGDSASASTPPKSDDKSWWTTLKQVGLASFVVAVLTNPYYNIDDLLKAITYFDENPLVTFAVKILIFIIVFLLVDRYT